MNWEITSNTDRVCQYDEEERRKFGNSLKRKGNDGVLEEVYGIPALSGNTKALKVQSAEFEPVTPVYSTESRITEKEYLSYFPEYSYYDKQKEYRMIVPPNLDSYKLVNHCQFAANVKKAVSHLDSIPVYRRVPGAPQMLPGRAGDRLVVQTNSMLQRSDGREQLYQYFVTFTPHVPSSLLRYHLFYTALVHGREKKEDCTYKYNGTQDVPSDMKHTEYCYLGGRKAFSVQERDSFELWLALEYENGFVNIKLEKRLEVAAMQTCDLLVQSRQSNPPDVVLECISAIYRAQVQSKQPNVRGLLITSHKQALQKHVLDLGRALVIVPATVYRTRPSSAGLYAVVQDVVGTIVFKPINLLEIMQFYKFADIFPHLKGLRVEHVHTKEVMTINGLTGHVASEEFFGKGDKKVSVATRAEQRYGVKLHYLSSENPAIQCGSKLRMFPVEHLRLLPGQVYRGPQDDIQKHLYNSFQSINPTVRTAITRFETKPTLGKQVVERGLGKGEMGGRVLPIPRVLMSKGSRSQHIGGLCTDYSDADTVEQDVSTGAWGLHSGKAIRPVDLKIGLLMHGDSRDDRLMLVLSQLKTYLEQLGCSMEITARKTYADRDDQDRFFLKQCHKLFEDVNLVLSTTPGGRDYFYGAIKRACMVRGLVSQNINSQNQLRMTENEHVRPEYVSNIAAKLITKLGGALYFTPNALLEARPTMILGCDVDHPAMLNGLWKKNAHPSHGCVVGSWDRQGQCYSGVSQQQGVKEEIMPSGHMFFAVVRFITLFKEHNGVLPEVIVYYRDGVSDHDQPAITQQELVAVRNASRLFGEGYVPKLLALVIVKRHPLRFTVPGTSDTVTTTVHHTTSGHHTVAKDGKTYDISATPNPFPPFHNPPLGFVLDHTLTRPQQNEFFLQSHVSNHTARPMLYQVVVNEPGYSMDEVQRLTFDLCFASQRTPRASSAPAPLLHAHTMCRHVRKLFIDHMNQHVWPTVVDYSKFTNKPFYM